jgi:hypothetical protein
VLTFSCILADFYWKLLMVRNLFCCGSKRCVTQFSSVQFTMGETRAPKPKNSRSMTTAFPLQEASAMTEASSERD